MGAAWLAAAGLPRLTLGQTGGAAGNSEPRPADRAHETRARIEPSRADRVVVPDGYASDVVLRWGDPLGPGAQGLDAERIAAGALLEPGAAEAQAAAVGVNCDGLGIFDLGEDRLLVCVNHEYLVPELMFPGWAATRLVRGQGEFVSRNPEAARVMQAAVGVSVVELRRTTQSWRAVVDSGLNRRITAQTPIVFSGPASSHPWLGGSSSGEPGRCSGTLGNCAAGTTPWGTYLTAEENVDDFFGNAGRAELDPDLEQAHRRFGLRFRDSVFRWEHADSRFDMAASPAEPMKFGWIVEIDPMNRAVPIKKRTALGRLKHEGATTVLTADGRPVVYTGDDEAFEYFYKFVGSRRFDPESPERNRDLLDEGTLYVARFGDDGTGVWLPLVWGEHAALTPARGFRSQADVLIRCREAADAVGATPLDRPEDVAVHPANGRVYFSCTQNTERGVPGTGRQASPVDRSTDAANPRARNVWGHILELDERGGDAAAAEFHWNVFVLAGDPRDGRLRVALPPAADGPLAPNETYFAGQADSATLSAFANPDNLGFDPDGNLWIVTDGIQPRGNNNGCFVCPTEGPERGAVRQFMSGPIGAEICGCEFAPDGGTLFLTVQHPGSGGTVERPISHWPDGGDSPPRSSLVAIFASDPARRFGA